MSARKPSSIATKIAATFAIAALSLSAFAGRYWLGKTADALFSETGNWATASGGNAGASVPGDGSGTTYFRNYTNGRCVFDALYTVPDTVRIDTYSETPFVWSATDSSYGMTSAANGLRVCEDSSKSPAWLRIDSGTYTMPYLRLGYADNAKVGLILNGGNLTITDARIADKAGVDATLQILAGTFKATSSFYASDIANSTNLIQIKGGTLDTTGPDYVRIGRSNDSAARIQLDSGAWNTKAFLVGGNTKESNNTYSNVTAEIVVDGGTLTATENCFIGANTGENVVSRMIVNDGEVYINANCLYVGDYGPGELTVNGGLLQLKNSDYGLNIGHKKSGKDVGVFTLNGGTLKPTKNNEDFLKASDNLICSIAEGGLTVDTDYDITIAHDLVGVGKIVKKGTGTLTLSGNNTYKGGIEFDGADSGEVVEGDNTYNASNPKPASGGKEGIDVSAGGDLGTIVLHGAKLEGWLKDADFMTNYSSKYGASGTASLERPTVLKVYNGDDEAEYTNLETGKAYTKTLGGEEFTFTTEDLAPRTFRIDTPSGTPADNVRDVGSWPLMGGGKMNQGVILRGGHLDGFLSATAEQRTASYLTTLGLKTEIDLRKFGLDEPGEYEGVTTSFAADNCAFYNFGLGYDAANGTQIGADDNGNFTNQVHNFFSTLGTQGRLPAYFHCRIGTDRTGVMGMLLLGLMGVDEDVIYRDYLMSNFANIGGTRGREVPETFLRYLLRGNCNDGKYVYDDNDYGLSVAARCRAYIEMCGVTTEEIGRITMALSGETPDQVLARVNAYETANEVRTVSYVPYAGSSTTNAMHRFAKSATAILPRETPTKPGYAFKGWDVWNEVDNGDGTAVVYAIWEVAARYWSDENGDEARFADGQSWIPAPESVLQAKDLLVLNKGVDKVAKMEYGDAVTVSKLYVGWGTLDAGATMSAADDKGGRLDMTGGTLNVADEFYIGAGYSDKSNNVVNVTGGHVTAGRLRTGDCASDGGKSNTLNISGSETVFETTKEETRLSNFSGGTTYVNVTDGAQFTSSQKLYVGYSGKATMVVSNATVDVVAAAIANGGGSAGTVVLQDGGVVNNNGSLHIGNGSGAVGDLTINGGAWTNSSDVVRVGSASGGTGTLTVNAGEFYFDKVMRVGSGGYGRLVIGGTGVVVDGTSGDTYLCFGSSDSIIRLNAGGKLQLRSILRDNSANGVVEFNGGEMIKPVEQGAYGYAVGSTAIDENHIVKILTGGMVFDTAGYNSKINGSVICQENSGGIRKKGAGKLTIAPSSGKTVSFTGPIYVEAGTLEFGNGVLFPEDGFVDVVRVAPGATLKLPQGTVLTCRVWDIEGSIEGGTVTQEPDYGLKFASMIVWTGAAGDDDIWNPENYRVCDQYGRTMYEQPIVITADTPITVPHGADLPSFEGLNDVSYEITQDIEGMTVPDFLATAAAWYDPSDGNTLTFDENNKVTGIQNKGSVGTDLDLVLRSSSKGGGVISNDKFFGKASIYLNNASGYRSSGYFPADVQASGPRTLFAVANGTDMCFISAAQHNGNEEGRSLLLAHSGGNFGFGYQVSTYNGTDWGKTRATFTRTINEPYVYSGRTQLGEGGYNTIMSSAIDAAGNENGNTVQDCYMPIPTEGENPQLRSFYGTFDIGWFDNDSQGYLGEALIFTNALSDAQMSEVQSYLKAKWLTMGLPEYDRIVLNADVDLRGTTRTLKALYGSGSFANGTIVINGTLTIAVAADGSVVAPSFDNLILGPNSRLVVKGAKNLPTQSTIDIIPFNSIEGEFKTLEGDNNVVVRVYYADDRVCARREAGFVLRMR